MRYLTLLLLTLPMHHSFGQGIVLDSLSSDPVPFANVVLSDTSIRVMTDFDGKFQVDQMTNINTVLTISAIGYSEKKVNIREFNDSLRVLLSPLPIDAPSFVTIQSKPKDTVFFKDGQVQKINYLGHDEEEFYPSGQIKFRSAGGSTRNWYETGQLQSQSLLKTSHFRLETSWFPNGQKKAEGTKTWRHNERTNRGEWTKNNDWRYWTKKGKQTTTANNR